MQNFTGWLGLAFFIISPLAPVLTIEFIHIWGNEGWGLGGGGSGPFSSLFKNVLSTFGTSFRLCLVVFGIFFFSFFLKYLATLVKSKHSRVVKKNF